MATTNTGDVEATVEQVSCEKGAMSNQTRCPLVPLPSTLAQRAIRDQTRRPLVPLPSTLAPHSGASYSRSRSLRSQVRVGRDVGMERHWTIHAQLNKDEVVKVMATNVSGEAEGARGSVAASARPR